MQKEVQIAAFEGGSLRVLRNEEAGREAVLALPLNRIIVKMVRVPAGEDAVAVSTPILKSMSPFPDEELTVSCETVSESESGTVVMAAAMPESAADDIGEALDAEKLSITRIDALCLGQLRCLWNDLEGSGRRLVLLNGADCISLCVLDGDMPVEIRAITDTDELKREVMLSLLAAEDFGGVKNLDEIVWVGEPIPMVDDLAAYAPVRKIRMEDPDAALRGIAERSVETVSLNVLPASWQEMLDETRFKAKLVRRVAVAGGIWLVIMGILFGVPMGYDFMTDHQKSLCKQHKKQYEAVKEMREKVKLVQKYSDHARGALEIMKALSDRLPEGMELASWDYKREDAVSGDGGVRISGDAEVANLIYDYKDAMDALSAGGEEDGEKVFGTVNLIGPTAGRGGRQKFNLDCQYKKESDE